jgi:molecular chaperone GrpE (heat shock protein)
MAKKISKEEVIRNALELVDQLKAAVSALESESNPETLLNHVGVIRDKGRIEALRGVLRDRSLELFQSQGKNSEK